MRRLCRFLYVVDVGFCKLLDDFAILGVGVIVAVGHDDVVNEPDVDGLCGTLHSLGQLVVVAAGAATAGRVVVYEYDSECFGQQCLFEHISVFSIKEEPERC